MITSSIDSIVRSILLRKRVPLHYYLDALLAARDVIRELTIDDLQIVNIKELPVSSYGSVTLPNDCADIAEVSIGVGANRRLLVRDDSINEVNYFDSKFNIVPYSSSNTGGYYYGTVANISNTYKVFRSKGEIQLNESLSSSNIIVAYIGDGRNADAASHIDVNAEATIEAYILWQFCEMSRSYSIGEKDRMKQFYFHERSILRARMAEWDFGTLRRIANRVRSIKSTYPLINEIIAVPAVNNYIPPTVQQIDVITLIQGANNYTVPAGTLIEKVLVLNAIGSSVGIGSTQGGYDLSPATNIVDLEALFQIDKYYPIETSIWFTGVPTLSTIKIYKR